MADFSYIWKQEYNLSVISEYYELIIYSLFCFSLPLLIGHPQIVVGVVVNASLILAALNLKGYKLLPVIMLPSLAVLTRGMIFGPFTIYLIYMIPIIWAGNAIFVWAFKKYQLQHKLNRWIVLLIGTALKAGLLFAVAFLLVKIQVLPVVFLTTMGLLQVYTAVLGGVLAYGVQSVKKRIFSN
jgi:hypothetical protein